MRRTKSKVKILIGLAIAVFAVVKYCSSTELNPYTGKKQAISLTPNQEIAIGLQSAPQMMAQHGGLHPDNRLQAFVDMVGQKLVNNTIAKQTPSSFDFHLLADNKTINAFALPGGQIFITYVYTIN